MAETWDREFFDIRDTEQRDGLVSVIEADASGVRDVGQTAERPQTVGEYTASLPVVQPEATAKWPAGGGDPLDPEWQERVITYGLAAWDTPQAEQEAQAEITDTSLVDAAPEPVAEFDATSPIKPAAALPLGFETQPASRTVGEYMATPAVVEPEVQQVPGPFENLPIRFGEEGSEPVFERGPLPLGQESSDSPFELLGSASMDATPPPGNAQWAGSTDVLRERASGIVRHAGLRQEQQRRQEARANIRQLSKTDPRAATEAANAERLERRRRQDWEDTFPDFEPQQEAEQLDEQPEPDKQRKLYAVARTTNTPPMLSGGGDVTFQTPFGGADEAVSVLREILAAIKELAGKMDPNARWGV